MKQSKKKLQMARAAIPKSVRQALAPTINSAIKNALRTGGGALGAASGAPLGMGVSGSVMGSKLGARLSKAIGSGDYQIAADMKANSLFKGDGPTMPSFGGSSVTRFKHREYIGDIYAGANNSFTLQKFPVQPSFRESFPYLAQISRNFTRYHMKGLIYEFVSTTSPYLAGGAMGSVIMAMQYDPALPDYTSKPQMENSDFAVSARPDSSILYGVECANQPVGGYYLRSSASLATQPLNFTDMGTMYVAVQNTTIASGTALGELWVTYDVEFAIPLITPARYGFSSYAWNTQLATSTNSPFTNAAYVGSVLIGDMSEAVVVSNATSATFTFPNVSIGDIIQLVGIVTYDTVSALASSTGLRWSGATRCQNYTESLLPASTLANSPNSLGQVCGKHIATVCVTVTGLSPTVTLSAPTVTTATISVAQVTATVLFGSGASF